MINILIPMAANDDFFHAKEYYYPKPLIELNGKMMIEHVIDNLNSFKFEKQFIFIVNSHDCKKHHLDNILNLLTDSSCKILRIDNETKGAACSSLMAIEYIDNDNPLFFANSDQFVEWDSTEFMYKMNETDADGGIVSFRATHPKWSFAKINESGLVTEVAEKNPISDIATVGYYYWKKGSDFVKYAEDMIDKDIRVNNELYVCPVFNQAIEDNKEIRTFDIPKMWGLGTPEDLKYYLENYGK